MGIEDRVDVEPQVTVVGAGPAGLAAAACIQRRGLPVQVLERSESVGTSWRDAYRDLRLDTARWASGLPGARFPRRAGRWSDGDDFAEYLGDYVRRNRLAVRTGIEVDRVRLERGLVLDTSSGPIRSSWVVLAGCRPLEPLVGHLGGVLDASGSPIVSRGRSHPDAPGLHIVGVRGPVGTLRSIRNEALDVAAAIVPVDPYDDRWWFRPTPTMTAGGSGPRRRT